jgi:hypothetical protein
MKFSFQFVIAFLTACITGAIFYLVFRFSSLPVFVIVSLLWFAVLTFFYLAFQEKRKDHTLLLTLSTALSSLLLFSIIDHSGLRIFFAVFVSLLLGILFGFRENDTLPLGYARRPFRRFAMMVWVFNAYAFFSCLFAIGVLFQSEWPRGLEFVLVPSAGIIGALIAGEIWKMYVKGEEKIFLFWRAITGLFIAQIFWSIRLLPFGYMVSGVLLTWLWYMLQMLIRFHLREPGIVWKKQLPFLIGSGLVFLFLFIFYIRWI